MSPRQLLCSFILLASVASGCCGQRQYGGSVFGGGLRGNPYGSRGLGLGRERGYGACVDNDDLYMLPPERMTRKENRELRQWYRELNYNGRYSRVSRMRGRGGMPGEYGFDMVGMGGCCECCGGCGETYPGEVGCPTYGDHMLGMSEGMMSTEPMMYSGGHVHGASTCPVCGQQGPVQQIAPHQMVPHDANMMPHSGAEEAAPAPPSDPPPMEPAPMPAEPIPAEPAAADDSTAQLQQMYFAPPLQAPR